VDQIAVQPWLRSARWDLGFIIVSCLIVLLPYSLYWILGGAPFESASLKGTSAYQARVTVNYVVAILIGGPHMYATFTRTFFDAGFRKRWRWFLYLSLLVPVIVFTMASASYQTYVWMLSIFFAVASVHALHQLVWITEAYNQKAKLALSLPSRAIDYALVLSSLYPLALLKMTQGEFKIGPVDLLYNQVLYGQYWLAYLALAGFSTLVVLFVAKTVVEYRAGYFSAPKTLLIGITASLMFVVPLLPNLDTAFQGVNTWHSFQYLALTWYANSLREKRVGRPTPYLHWLNGQTKSFGERLAGTPRQAMAALRRVDGGSGWVPYYAVCLAMLPISGALILVATALWPNIHNGAPGADEAYSYMGILSILLMHYVHDALLFFDSRSILPIEA